MYNEIYGTSLNVFDDQTSEYIGKARFDLPPEAEKKLLDLINFSRVPDNLIVSSVQLLPHSDNYVPPDPFEHVRRHSTFHAMVRDGQSKKQTPIEIELKYDRMARSCLTKDPNRFESAQINNIEIIEIRSEQI